MSACPKMHVGYVNFSTLESLYTFQQLSCDLLHRWNINSNILKLFLLISAKLVRTKRDKAKAFTAIFEFIDKLWSSKLYIEYCFASLMS